MSQERDPQLLDAIVARVPPKLKDLFLKSITAGEIEGRYGRRRY